MKKFRFWAVFGLVFNGVALIRGIGYALALTPHFTALSIGTALCSAIGIYCSILILKQNAKGFRLAKRQVWFVAAHEAIAIHLRAPRIISKSQRFCRHEKAAKEATEKENAISSISKIS